MRHFLAFLVTGLLIVSSELSVPTGGVQALGRNDARKMLLIQNKGANNVHISFNTQGGVGVGILIEGGGAFAPIHAPVNALFLRSTLTSNPVTIITGE